MIFHIGKSESVDYSFNLNILGRIGKFRFCLYPIKKGISLYFNSEWCLNISLFKIALGIHWDGR